MPANYKIPQNVELEDKIIGPFTMRQFMYLLAGGLITFLAFSMFYTASPALFIAIAALTWLIVGAFVFIKPYDRSFLTFLTSFFSFSTRPTRRAWKRLPSLGEIKLEEHQAPPKVRRDEPSDEEIRSKLSKLAHVVDARGWSTVDSADTEGRIVSDAEATQKLNIFMADEDQPEDILAREDDGSGPGRASTELGTILQSVPKVRPRNYQQHHG